MKKYERHELSALDGDMSEDDFKMLIDSIDINGVLEPVMFWEGKILDGWHRYLACQELKIASFRKMEYEGNDPSGYVFAKSLRKSKTPFERGALIVGLQSWETKRGRPSLSLKGLDGESFSRTGLTIPEQAAAAGVSESTIHNVKNIKGGIPELEEAVKAKKISIKDAAEIARLPTEEQKEALEKALQEKEEKKSKKNKPKKDAKKSDTVPLDVYEALQKEFDDLQDHCENLVATLKRCEFELQAVEALKNNEQVKLLMDCHDQIKSMTDARDQVMIKNAELQRQINYINKKSGK
jgi:ParB-like chromosome segregation protein Spo0J